MILKLALEFVALVFAIPALVFIVGLFWPTLAGFTIGFIFCSGLEVVLFTVAGMITNLVWLDFLSKS